MWSRKRPKAAEAYGAGLRGRRSEATLLAGTARAYPTPHPAPPPRPTQASDADGRGQAEGLRRSGVAGRGVVWLPRYDAGLAACLRRGPCRSRETAQPVRARSRSRRGPARAAALSGYHPARAKRPAVSAAKRPKTAKNSEKSLFFFVRERSEAVENRPHAPAVAGRVQPAEGR